LITDQDYYHQLLSVLTAGDSPAHPSSGGTGEDEDSLGYAEKLAKGLTAGSEFEEEITSLISPR